MAQTDWPVEEFRNVLDRILDRTRLTQTALAALVPMDQSQLSRWKSGASRPKYENLAALADAVERDYPHTGITKREILASGGYGATLEVLSPEPRPGAALQVINGDAPLTLTPEQVLYDQIAAYERGEADEPEQPPGGFDPRYLDSEQRIWRMRSFSLIRRWEIIKGMRQADEESAEEERRKAAQRHNDEPREA